MEQKIESLATDDTAHMETQRTWVRDHFTPEAIHKYETLEGKLELLEGILANGWIEPHETWKLQSLGIAFGDALAQKAGLYWCAVEDDYGRSPALQDLETTLVLFPQTMISKRVERGETVDVRGLFDGLCAEIERLRSELPHRTVN